MNGGQTKNAALKTALAFHYQLLIGLDKCFGMEEGQSVWFEKDGDVSLISSDALGSIQTEVKNYSAPLTDHHENLWKTLKNWLAPDFNHAQYGALVLHTTQAFGATTHLKDWNEQTAAERLQVLEEIFFSRSEVERNAENPSEIIKLQKKVVVDSTSSDLKAVLEKVVLHVESADLEKLRKTYLNKLSGYIPISNRQAFAEGLIGFVYEQADDTKWVIDKTAFDQKRETLTFRWGPSSFTIPDLVVREATEVEVDKYITEFFAQKIIDIDYQEVLSEAIGSWLELRNALIEEMNGYPQFRKVASRYRERWIKAFLPKYRIACRKQGNTMSISQDLYDQAISEIPFSIDEYKNPDIIFRNGLIHDAMDDEQYNLKWKVEP